MTAMSVPADVPAGVPCSGLEWRQWAREQVERLELSAGEANVLRLLADRANARGAVTLGIAIFVRQLRLSESQVYRLLQKLTDRRLLQTTPRGRGRVPLRELVAEPTEKQLSLFDDPPADVSAAAGSPPLRAAADTGVRPAPPAQPCPRIDARMPSHQCDPAVEGAAATAPTEEGARERAQAPPPALSPSLPAVLAILEQADGLHVVDAAVNAALSAYADFDHERAAWTVVSWAQEGGLAHSAANRLLMSALRKQLEQQPPRGCDDRGRRRGGRQDSPPRRLTPLEQRTCERIERLRALGVDEGALA